MIDDYEQLADEKEAKDWFLYIVIPFQHRAVNSRHSFPHFS